VDENPKSTGQIREYQDKPGGQFKEGNPGKPKGAKNKYSMAKLEKAMEAVEDDLNGDIFKRFVEMAWYNPGLMIALMKKFVPDKEKIEHDIPEGRKITIEHIGRESKGN